MLSLRALASAVTLVVVVVAVQSAAFRKDGGSKAGSVAFLSQFPWHAAILRAEGGGLLGSGALLSQQFVLTAASALEDQGKQVAKVSVLLGAVSTSDTDGKGKTVHSKALVRHEKWNSETAENDLALVQLDVAVLIDNRVTPIRLPPRYARGATYAGQTLSVSTWGSSDADSQGDWLSVYNVAIMRNMDCQMMQSDPTQKLPWTKMCGLAEDGSSVPGKQNNGDPLVFLERDDAYTLVGIVCSDVQATGSTTLARLTEQLDWIQANSDVTIED